MLHGSVLSFAWYSMSPFDCLVLAHFLVWCDSSLKLLDLSGCGLTSQSFEIMHRAILEHHGTTQIEEVNLGYNNSMVITKFLLLLKLPMFKHTKVLKACGLQYSEGISCAADLLCLLNMKHLTTLEISVKKNPGLDSEIYLSLNKFQCQHGNVDSQNAVDIFGSLQHSTSLEELDLSGNSQLAEGDSEAVGCAIERMLIMNRTLKVLNLSGCNVTDPVVKHILTALMKNISLVTLHIGSPKLSSSCAVSLFQQMTTHPTLSITVGEVNILGVGRVKMDRGSLWCVIGDLIPENCVEFFRALNNNGLKVTKLNVQDLTDQTAEHFAVGLAESQSVQALKLKHCNISSAGAVSIFRSLEHNTSLEELDLSGNWQLAEGNSEAVGCAIERMLNVNRTLKVLNLYGCRLTNDVASHFANGLAQNHSLRKVILHSNNISSAGAVSIFRSLEHNTSLEELDLSGNSQLTESDSEAVGCAIERMLNVNRTLKVLNLSGCNVTDRIVKHILTGLTKNTSLVTLDIGSLKLSVSCAVSLFQQMTTHPTVSITVDEVNVLGVGRVKMDRGSLWCVIGDLIPENCVEFFRALNNNGLKVTKLNVQDLTDQTAEHFAVGLAESQSVQALQLIHNLWEKNNIGSAGAVSIFRSLEHNTSLEKLDLSGNSQLAEGGGEAVGCAIERMLNVNRTLKVLNLSGCSVTDPIVKHILTGLTKNTSLVTLDMSSPKLSGSCAVSLFQQMSTHPTLSITVGEVNVLGFGKVMMDGGTIWCFVGDLIPESCVEFFRALNNSGLKISNLNAQGLTDQTVEHFAVGLAESQSVQAFKLEHCNISSTGAVSIFRLLEHNTSLEELDLSNNSQLAEGDSEAVGCAIERMLNVNKTLKVLNLSDCNVTDPVVKHILSGVTNNTSIVTLDMGSLKLSGSCAVSLFQQMTTHPILSISVGKVNVLGVGRVDIDRGTIRCVIGDMIPENCVEFFRALNNSGLKVSKLIVEDLTDQTVENFVVGLAESQSVQALKLSHSYWEKNIISSASAVSIFQSLEHNTSLEELDLSGNSQLAEGDSEAVGCAIERMLNVNRTLKVLNLSGCGFANEVAAHFSNGLVQNCVVQKVVLCSNHIGSTGAVNIFRSLEHNTSLEELDLSGNSQLAEGDSEAVGCAIERMLNVNRTLKVLNLSGCGFANEVAAHFSNGLVQNCVVQKVVLCSNHIGSTGAVNIFRSLEHNTSLEELDLSGNSQLAEGDSEAVGCAIERMLNGNRTLKVLNLSDCEITDSIVKCILTGLAKNTSLVTLKVRLSKLSVSCAVSLFQLMTTHPTLSITVGEVNVLGVGRVKMDRGTLWCVIGDLIAENCVEFFRALNNSGLKVSKLIVEDLTDQTAENFAVGLAESQSVQALKLGHSYWEKNIISSASAVRIFRSLEHNTSLEELDLSQNSQLAKGDSEAVGCAIERMLNGNRTLKVLNLSHCNVTDPIVIHILTGLTKNTSLVTLDIKSPILSVSCAVSLFQQMSNHPTLSITVSEVIVLGVGTVEMDRETIRCVIGDLIPENCVEFFRALNNSGLKVSKLIVENLTDQTAENFAVGLAESQWVQALKLSHSYWEKNIISSAGAVRIFRSLEHNTSLEELDLSQNSQLVEGDSEAVGCAIERMLNVNRILKVLNLSDCNLTDPVVEHILTGLTKNTSLVTLDIKSPILSVSCPVSPFQQMSNHPTLSVSCAVSLFQQMSNHPTLSITVSEVNVLGVGRVEIDRGTIRCVIGDLIAENCVEFFRALNNSGLKVSNLNVQDLTDQTAEHLAFVLAECQSFEALTLSHSNLFGENENISSAGAVSILRSLPHNTSLEELDLSGNSKLSEGDKKAVGCAIERMLNVNRTLKLLNLARCGFSSEVASSFSNGLAQNHSVRELILHSNNIGSTGQ